MVEIKSGLVPQVTRGFHLACEDLAPDARFVVHAGADRYPVGAGLEAIGLRALAEALAAAS